MNITPAMVTAAYRVMAVETGLPYGASIREYTRPDGTVDYDGLKAADAECERKNRRIVRRVLEAALGASAPPGRPARRK
jgi:hypothetical protein